MRSNVSATTTTNNIFMKFNEKSTLLTKLDKCTYMHSDRFSYIYMYIIKC